MIFFTATVSSLDIGENKALLSDCSNINDPVGRAIKKFENHTSILDIRNHVSTNSLFSFSEVGAAEMLIEIKDLNDKKSGTFMNTCEKIKGGGQHSCRCIGSNME